MNNHVNSFSHLAATFSFLKPQTKATRLMVATSAVLLCSRLSLTFAFLFAVLLFLLISWCVEALRKILKTHFQEVFKLKLTPGVSTFQLGVLFVHARKAPPRVRETFSVLLKESRFPSVSTVRSLLRTAYLLEKND